jgi:mRNA interferase HigB
MFPDWEHKATARDMHVIAKKRLREFGAIHPAAVTPLDDWYRIMEGSRFHQPSEVKEVLGQTDFIDGSRAVFNVGGNKFRIVADVVFRYQIVLVRHVFTHKEYDAWNKAQRQGR